MELMVPDSRGKRQLSLEPTAIGYLLPDKLDAY